MFFNSCKLIDGYHTLNNRVSFFLVLVATLICCRSRHTQVEDSLKMDDQCRSRASDLRWVKKRMCSLEVVVGAACIVAAAESNRPPCTIAEVDSHFVGTLMKKLQHDKYYT